MKVSMWSSKTASLSVTMISSTNGLCVCVTRDGECSTYVEVFRIYAVSGLHAIDLLLPLGSNFDRSRGLRFQANRERTHQMRTRPVHSH